MKRPILLTTTLLFIAAMLVTPFVSAKPEVWSAEFSLTTLPDPAGDMSKLKYFSDKAGPILVNHIPTIGEVEFSFDGDTYTGVVTQMVLCSKLYLNNDPMKVMGNEKWVFTFDEGTLEVSANFWIEDMTTQPNGGGTCIGTYGTGIFEDAIFKGTFTTIMIPTGTGGILKTQFGSGELKFP